MNRRLIAITGGIGSGKSVVSAILRILRYPVYDCDTEAKRIMDSDRTIIDAIASDIAADAIRPDGTIDRQTLGRIVFGDAAALQRLNSIVHGAVRRHLSVWYHNNTNPLQFVETAILYQSGLDRIVDEVWEVTAPDELRILRVMERNGLTREEVEHRIASQRYEPATPHAVIRQIANGYNDAILPQLRALLESAGQKL